MQLLQQVVQAAEVDVDVCLLCVCIRSRAVDDVGEPIGEIVECLGVTKISGESARSRWNLRKSATERNDFLVSLQQASSDSVPHEAATSDKCPRHERTLLEAPSPGQRSLASDGCAIVRPVLEASLGRDKTQWRAILEMDCGPTGSLVGVATERKSGESAVRPEPLHAYSEPLKRESSGDPRVVAARADAATLGGFGAARSRFPARGLA